MQDQLKTLRSESKDKVSTKVSAAADELQYLMDFNGNITQAAAKAIEHLTDFVFISMGNFTLARRDAYMSHLRTGIKPDTLTATRTAPLQISTLFPDSVIKNAEEDIAQFFYLNIFYSQSDNNRTITKSTIIPSPFARTPKLEALHHCPI